MKDDITAKEIRGYFERWKRNKSAKFTKAVEKAAEEMAVEMFVDLVKKLEQARKRISS